VAVELTSNPDSLVASVYLSKDSDADGGKLKIGPPWCVVHHHQYCRWKGTSTTVQGTFTTVQGTFTTVQLNIQ
jgi:hypothetical protein